MIDLREANGLVERIILRRLFEERLDGYTIETAEEIVAALSPQPQPGAVDNPIAEVWRGTRKVSVYENEVIRVWGADIDNEMSSMPRNLETVQAAFDWLYTAPPLAPNERMRKALERCAEGWSNVLELDLLPERHRETAVSLRDAALDALCRADSHHASETKIRKALEKIAGSHWERIGHCQSDVDDVPDLTAEEAMREAREALSGAADASNASAEARDFCTYGPPDERKRRWVVIFDDPDKGTMVFDDEKEAHTAWDRAKDNWTCTLFETSARKYYWAAGELRALSRAGDNHASDGKSDGAIYAEISKRETPLEEQASLDRAIDEALNASPEDATAQREAWPKGCQSPISCSRNHTCMYFQCVHEGRNIEQEIDHAILALSTRAGG